MKECVELGDFQGKEGLLVWLDNQVQEGNRVLLDHMDLLANQVQKVLLGTRDLLV